jgi:hypothetical protein
VRAVHQARGVEQRVRLVNQLFNVIRDLDSLIDIADVGQVSAAWAKSVNEGVSRSTLQTTMMSTFPLRTSSSSR